MTQEQLEELITAKASGTLSALEETLLDTVLKMRKIVVRAMDRHPVLVRAWDNDGMATVKACSCADCIALRKAAVGVID